MPPHHPLLNQEFKEQAELVAANMRDALNLPKHAPLCAFKLANHLGIPIKSIYDYGIVDDGEPYDDWSAMLIYKKSGNPVIIHNIRRSQSRQQSDIMHEIGHYYCKHPLIPQPVKGPLPTLMMATDPRHEQEAFYLGATLQLPRVALSWAVHGEQMTVEEIAKKFVASRQMVQYRINVMGLSKDMKLLQTERQ